MMTSDDSCRTDLISIIVCIIVTRLPLRISFIDLVMGLG